MERPDTEVLDELEAALTDLAEAEAAVKVLKARVGEITLSIRDRVADQALLLALVKWLYWMVPRINANTLAVALFGQPNVHRLRKLVGPVTAGFRCAVCGAEVTFGSRTALPRATLHAAIETPRPSSYSLFCQQCTAAMRAQSNQQFDARLLAERNRLRELKAMPYSDYLKTPEWHERRRRHLRSAGHRCQVCNAANTRLNVHHRTYASIGEEKFVDLLVLCENCHTIFHNEGKLVRE